MLKDNGTYWESYNLNSAKDFLWDAKNGESHPERVVFTNWLKDYIKEYDKPSFLDAACGSGIDYAVLKDLVDYTGYDRTQVMLDALKAKYPEAKVVNGEIRQLPFKDNSFDIVHARAIFEHLPGLEDSKIAIDELYRVAKNVLVLVFYLPLEKETKINWNTVFYENRYGHDDIMNILNGLGGKVTEINVPFDDKFLGTYTIFTITKCATPFVVSPITTTDSSSHSSNKSRRGSKKSSS